MAVQPRTYTVEEFEQILALPENQNRILELIRGEIVEKMPTWEHAIIAGLIVTWINLYLMSNNMGYAGVEGRFRPAEDRENDLIPDVSFIADRSKPIVTRGSTPYSPDLAVEIKSPDQSTKELRDKAKLYLANGTRLVWLVYPEQRLVEYYSLSDEGFRTENELLDGGDVLPGFSVTVRDIFPKQQG